MGKSFQFAPVEVGRISTPNREIGSDLPVPASEEIIRKLRKYEPLSMSGQPLVVWDRAEGVHVHDAFGNKWLDFSSGVLVANAGHGRKEAAEAIARTARRPLHHAYCFPNAERAALVEHIVEEWAPDYLDKVFLLTTGSEAMECAIKVSRAYGHSVGGPEKDWIVGYQAGFHGRTLGSQMAGGIPALKDWIVHHDPCMVSAPVPDGFRGRDTSFDGFLRTLGERGIDPRHVAAVVLETYQGGTAILLPHAYVRELRAFCDENGALLVFDEVQAGFGRCGRKWGFEHYGVRADIIVCGKGMSSGMPISAVIGNGKWMNIFPPGSMTSTHTGSPICCAAALANLRLILEEDLIGNAARLEPVLAERMARLEKKHPENVGRAAATGLVGAVQMVKGRGSHEPDADTAFDIVSRCVQRGLLLFAPVGMGGGTVKLCPPLMIAEDQLLEGLEVLEEAFEAVCG